MTPAPAGSRWRRPRVLLWALAAALLATWAVQKPAPGASARVPEARVQDAEPSEPAMPVPLVATPTRNLFEYGRPEGVEAPPRSVPRSASSAPVAPAASPTPAPATVGTGPRLVGIVRRGGQIRAALAVGGEMAVLGVGETLNGFTVLAVDEEEGVRLRGASGEELTLRPPL